jgi:DNA invertase Pin-like site-specific DNA recombinase
MKKLDGYIRVSSINGRSGASFISPDVQRETIERVAAAKGHEVDEIVTELDVSGSKRVDDRELERLIERVERGESEQRDKLARAVRPHREGR